VAPHPLPKTLVCSLKRPTGAGECHDSSLSAETLMGKLSWPTGSGQGERALWTNDGQEARPDESI